MNEIVIDAKNKPIGRVASQAAYFLQGKHNPSYVRHKTPACRVKIINTESISIPPKKLGQKIYTHYSGYPGGLKKETLMSVIERKGNKEVLRRAIYGMLPRNRQRKIMLINLIIE